MSRNPVAGISSVEALTHIVPLIGIVELSVAFDSVTDIHIQLFYLLAKVSQHYLAVCVSVKRVF